MLCNASSPFSSCVTTRQRQFLSCILAISRPSLLHQSKYLNKISVAQRRCLSLHEYQAQHLLAQYDVPVPRGGLATTATEVAKHINDFGGRGVIKSQILAGGRGKGYFGNGFKGGVRVVSSLVALPRALFHRHRYDANPGR